MGDAAREPEAVVGRDAAAVVVAAPPVGVLLDGQRLRLAPGDLVGRRGAARGDDGGGAGAVGIGRDPLGRTHPAHRAADDQRPGGDAEQVGDQRLDPDLVADRDLGEARAPRLPVGGLGGGPGGAAAAAQHVGGHDEPAVGVDGGAGSDEPGPPAGRRLPRTGWADDVGVAGEGVLDQDRVAAVGGERAPGLDRHDHVGQQPPVSSGTEPTRSPNASGLVPAPSGTQHSGRRP
ncbi:hypothetical protein GCM10025872_12510 [Barrientosiimonas endolithica]|uniref:Uncharacterized protein n=1 Tax=Barrientosiimonas endolithica TaxID=1535208 RepID=A0ABM8H9I9_9MICO|nr:hypothetical protein GCM10025872_12510 [Barrientosiimonas endolithica]